MNTENYTKADSPKIIGEAERTLNSYKSRVDPERTKDNYDLAEKFGDRSGETPTEKLERLIDETPHSNRKDLKVLGTWVIDPPKELMEQHPEDIPKFFEEAYKFFRDRVGAENVLYGAVHMDETTPHLQFGYCPVVEDRKNPGQKKICVTEANPLSFVKKAHETVSKYMTEKMGYEVSMLTGATENGKLRIEELKAETLQQQNKELQAKNSELEQRLSHVETALATVRKEQQIRKGKGLPEGKEKLKGPRLNKEVVSVTYTRDEDRRLRGLAEETLIREQTNKTLNGSELLKNFETLQHNNEVLKDRLRDAQAENQALTEQYTETVWELLPYERETLRDTAAEMSKRLTVSRDHSEEIQSFPDVLEMANTGISMSEELLVATVSKGTETPDNIVDVRNTMLDSVRAVIVGYIPTLNALNSALSDSVKTKFGVIRETIRSGLRKALTVIGADADSYMLLPDREPPIKEKKAHHSNSTPDGR